MDTTKLTGRGSRSSTSGSERPACNSARSSAADSKAQRRYSSDTSPRTGGAGNSCVSSSFFENESIVYEPARSIVFGPSACRFTWSSPS